MSKASEYAARVRSARASANNFIFAQDGRPHCWVELDTGNLAMAATTLPAQHVPALIAWLQDTFCDPPPVVYSVGGCGVHDATSVAAAEALIQNDPRANVVITCQPSMPNSAEWERLYRCLLTELTVRCALTIGCAPTIIRLHGDWSWRAFMRPSGTPVNRGPCEHERGPSVIAWTRVVWYWANICIEGDAANPDNALAALVAWLRSMEDAQ